MNRCKLRLTIYKHHMALYAASLVLRQGLRLTSNEMTEHEHLDEHWDQQYSALSA